MKASSVLVHAPNWVGDHAMAFPFYTALRELLPETKIVLIGRSWIADLAPDKLGSIVAFKGKEPAADDLQRLRAENFDLGFTLSPSFRSALLLRRLGAKIRYGFASDMRSILLTREKNKFRRQPYNRHEHRALAYLRLLNPLLPAGMIAEDLWEKHRNVKLATLPFDTVEKKFGLRRNTQRVVVCPGSTAASKKYPVGHVIRMIETITNRKPAVEFLLLGAKIDQVECDAISAHFAGKKIKLRSLCAQTSLREAHTIIAWSQVAVANDSGLAHITSLTGSALVTFNGMGRREETSPLTHRKTFFDLQLECSPCFAKVCPRKDQPLACLTGIAPDAVAKAVLYSL
ncbi:MAG: glycosyltransferase family 9 protein [Turneriella sp.]